MPTKKSPRNLVALQWILLLCAVGQLGAQQSIDDIQNLIRQLESRKFDQRQQAAEQLWKLGRKAEPFLNEALNSKNSEVVERARLILKDFESGIYPDTDRPTINLIRQFRDGNLVEKHRSGRKLVETGNALTFIKLILNEPDEKTRSRLVQQLDSDRLVRPLILKRRSAEAIDILRFILLKQDQLTLSRNNPFVYDYLWLALQNGSIESEIERFRSRDTDSSHWLRILQLRSVKRLDDCLQIARKMKEEQLRSELPIQLLLENRRWSELSDHFWKSRQDPLAESNFFSSLMAMTIHRLADQPDRYNDMRTKIFEFADALVAEFAIDDDADLFESVNNNYLFTLSEYLLVNGEVQQAAKYLKQLDRFNAFETLRSYHQNQTALTMLGQSETPEEIAVEILERIRRTKPKSWSESTREVLCFISIIDEFYQLGYYDQAKSMYRALFSLANRYEFRRQESLTAVCRAMLQNQQEELFFELIKPVLNEKEFQFAIDSLLPETSNAIELIAENHFWWDFLKREFNSPPLERLRVMQGLLGPVPRDRTMSDFETKVVQKLERQTGVAEEFIPHFLAALYLRFHQTDKAVEVLEPFVDRTGSPVAAFQLGDLFRKKGELQKAYRYYLLSWTGLESNELQASRRSVPGLYLAGLMARELKNKKTAEAHLQLAREYMLMGPETQEVIDALFQRKYTDEAINLCQESLRISSFQSWDQGSALSSYLNGIPPKEGILAADLLEKLMIDVCSTGRSYTSLSSYSYFAVVACQNRFNQLVHEGKVQAAYQELIKAIKMRPCSATIAEECLPLLRRANDEGAKLADGLFEKIRSAHLERLKSFPNSGLYNNNLAWICSVNGKHLDDALTRAELAVKNEPDNPSYLDTLADVCFNRGDKERAIQVMKKCLLISPDSEHYRLQLARFSRKSND